MESREIGKKIRSQRQQRGITQMELADRVGVSYQQVQKYESGATRISIDRLSVIASALEAPLSAFLAEYNQRQLGDKSAEPPSGGAIVPRMTREERQLLRFFASIRSRELKRTVLRLIEGIVKQQE